MAKVDLHLENETELDIEVRAYVEHPRHAPEELALGNIPADGERAETDIPARRGGSIAVRAFHLGQQVFQWRHTISSYNEVFTVSISLQKGQQIQDPDDALSLIVVSRDFDVPGEFRNRKYRIPQIHRCDPAGEVNRAAGR